jgi:hypothetical protein
MNIKTAGIIVGVILLLGLGFFLGIKRHKTLSGKATGAIVDSRYETEETTTGSGKNRRTKTENNLVITYHYTVNGVEHRRDSEIGAGSTDYRVGKQGTVCYDPKNPQSSEFYLSDRTCG